MQLSAGAVDFLPSLDREGAGQLSSAGFATVEGRALDITFNTKSPQLDKPEVRLSIGLALDRARIAGPSSLVKCLPWPRYSQRETAGHDKDCPYDPAKAKALIAQAGVTGSKITIMSRSQSEP